MQFDREGNVHVKLYRNFEMISDRKYFILSFRLLSNKNLGYFFIPVCQLGLKLACRT